LRPTKRPKDSPPEELPLAKPPSVLRHIAANKLLYLMLIPGLAHLFLFRYVPAAYLATAFQDYTPYEGLFGSEWVAFKHFERLFTSGIFGELLRNTAIIAGINLLLFFPAPIIVAILLNELRSPLFKRAVQTVIYVPHFISWPVAASITHVMLTTQGGIVNEAIVALGFEPVRFLMSEQTFHGVYLGQLLWKEVGYSTIVYLASIAGVSPSLYESAIVDGAGRFRRMWSITLPSIRSTIVILFLLRLGRFLEVGFEQVFLLRNPLNRSVSEIFDTYVYSFGVVQGQYSYTAAIGVFTSIVGLVLVIGMDRVAKRVGEEGVL
jgi:putative aldouronate transport system permease protein